MRTKARGKMEEEEEAEVEEGKKGIYIKRMRTRRQ